MDAVDCVIVGAGVIGLAIARELALTGREVVVLEQENAIGSHTSSRNSEVIHAGIYYSAGSLMARACVEGKRALYDYCAAHGVPHHRIGKLIVATDAQEAARLATIAEGARRNGVDDLQMLDGNETRRLEPALKAEAALLSPSTGIVDTHALMLSYLGDAEAAGAALALSTPFDGAEADGQGFVVRAGGAEPMRLRCRILVNAAGLFAPDVARRIDGMPEALTPTPYYARGVYFTLSGRAPFSRLIYPVPVPGGLGTHLTLDLGGQAKFGPDVEWIDRPDYSVDEGRRGSFAAAVRRYWPALDEARLVAGYAGVRPKLAPAGAPARDFLVQGPADHGVPGLVNLFGIESPGLTASLFLARHAAERLAD